MPKAATLFRVRKFVLAYGQDGIRANAVNAERHPLRSAQRRDDLLTLDCSKPTDRIPFNIRIEVELYQGESVDYNLDDFRNVAFRSGCNLVDTFYLLFGVMPDPANHF